MRKRHFIYEFVAELEDTFRRLSIRPVWIGGIAVGLITEPVFTYDMDILVDREDFLTLKRKGRRFGVVYKAAGSFRYKGEVLECIVEGEKLDDYVAPSPDAIRGEDFEPTIEGLFLLKLSRLYGRDRAHLAMLYDFEKPNEVILRNLIETYGDEKLWKRYLRLRKFLQT